MVDPLNISSSSTCVAAISFRSYQIWITIELFEEARGSVVIKALCYKPKGCGLENRLDELAFSIYLIHPAALGPEVYSDSNRN
jgi:hypothetical protein